MPEQPVLRAVDFDPFEAPPAAAPEPVELPLTGPQREMWSAAIMGGEASCSYNQCFAFTLRGPLQLDSLKAALEQVVARHGGLRVTVAYDGSSQLLRPPFAVELPFLDLSTLDPDARGSEINRLLEAECGTPFDLTTGPLFRAQVVRESADCHRFVFTAHHIVCDGWSSSVLFADLGRLYAAECVGIPAQLPPAASYERYVESETSPEHATAAAMDEDYWAGQFPGPAPVLELPLERPRPPVKTFRSAQQVLAIDGELYDALKRTGARSGATLFATLLAALEVLVYRLSGQLDFVVGIPLAGQLQLEDPALVAHCVSTVPLPAQLDPSASFLAHLRTVRQRVAEAQDHGRLTFGSLLARLGVTRDRSRTPLVPITFNIDRVGAPFDFGDLEIEALATPKAYSNFELMLNAVDSGADVRLECDHNLDLFSAATVNRWLSHYRTLLRDIVIHPDDALEALSLLDEEDRRKILVEWNDATMTLPAEKRLHRLFEAQVRRTPDAQALVDGSDRLSYAELNARANRLAHRLREVGVGPEIAVGVCLHRSADLIVALIAVLKAGGFYVPLDPAYPGERIELMLADSRARALVTTMSLGGRLTDFVLTRIYLDAESGAPATGSPADLDGGAAETNLAYVSYMSGATGVPKGVAIEHRSAGTLIHWARTVFSHRQLSGVLASTSVCFDLSIFELFLPLAFGGRVILAPSAIELGAVPARDEVTLLNTVPSTASELVRARALPTSIETVCLAGEPLSTRLVDDLYATGHVRAVYSFYGPSEATTYSTWTLRRPGEPPMLGRPIANTQAYVLGPKLVPVPIGVVGELYLAGDGLARCYLHREALTAERFVSGPFGAHPVTRAYRTGDLARYRPDGTLEIESKALPPPQVAPRPPAARIAPRTSTETRVAAIFREVLATPVASVDDNFFDLGGHSMNAVRVLTAIRAAFGVEVSLRHLFERPTVAGLAEMVDVVGVGAQTSAASAGREQVEI
jgi:amino acid adenylation domain-containing protein